MKKLITIFILFICSSIFGQKIISVKNTAGSGVRVNNAGIIGKQSTVSLVVGSVILPYTYSTQYRAVMDYAIANNIDTPSRSQNIINDVMVKNLVGIGVWDSCDIFYYFQQEAGTPYQFLTLNWVNPSIHRLTKGGANDVAFVADSGFKVTGGNNQYFNMNFTPSTDSVNFIASDNGVVFKTFGIASTFSQNGRIYGGASVSTSRVQSINEAAGLFSAPSYQSGGSPVNGSVISGFEQSKINGHYQVSSLTDRKYYKDGYFISDAFQYSLGSGSENAPLCLFGNNYLGTKYPSEGPVGLSYFILGSAFRNYNREIYQILNHTYADERTLPGTLGFTTAQTSGFGSLYFFKIYPSAPFKAYFSGITKDYIVTYSTDHAGDGAAAVPSNGAIGWGQCDNLMLSGYEDKGVIIAGYQSETPSLIINPRDPNGENVWLFYHPSHTYPDAGGYQQTRLWTTAGGTDLNHTTYTDRGKVLGLDSIELTYDSPHTGYADVYMEADSSFTVMHNEKGWTGSTISTIPKWGKSTNPGNSYVFTRIDRNIDISSFMPFERLYHFGPSLFFKRNGIQYAVARKASWKNGTLRTDNFVSIYRCDGSYHPTSLWGDISGINGGTNTTTSGFYIEGDVLYIYYVSNFTNLYVTTWDLKNLD